MKYILYFLFILGFSLGGLMMYSQRSRFFEKSEVLSYQVQTEVPVPTVTESPLPTPSITPVPTPKPSPTIINSPKSTLSPTPSPEITAPSDLEPLFKEFSDIYKVDKNKLKSIADCESHFNRGVLADPYAGMYQFTESTWIKYRNLMGKDSDVSLRFGARESIETAAFVLSIGDSHIWPSCN